MRTDQSGTCLTERNSDSLSIQAGYVVSIHKAKAPAAVVIICSEADNFIYNRLTFPR